MGITIELPEFEKFYELSNKILEQTIITESLKILIEETEAEIVSKVFENPGKYGKSGKIPSMAYVTNTYKVNGIEDIDISKLRKQLIMEQARLEQLKREYDILKITVETWRTQSANERGSFS